MALEDHCQLGSRTPTGEFFGSVDHQACARPVAGHTQDGTPVCQRHGEDLEDAGEPVEWT